MPAGAGSTFIELPTDSGNTGKLVRTWERNVTLNTGATANVREHFTQIVGSNSGNLVEANAVNQLFVIGRSASGLTPNAAGSANVSTSSAQVLGVNANRTGFVCTNLATNNIYLAFNGNAAALNSGVALLPGASFSMDDYSYTTGQINAISTSVTNALSYQEFQ
jgi:hypothetical protein